MPETVKLAQNALSLNMRLSGRGLTKECKLHPLFRPPTQSRTQSLKAFSQLVGRQERPWRTAILLPQDFCNPRPSYF